MKKNHSKYKVYLDTRNSYIECKNISLTSLDKYILTLSAGAFGLSLTFINEIVPEIGESTIIFLKLAWFIFLTSILSTLFSFLSSKCAFDIEIRKLDDYYANGKSDIKRNIPSIITRILNVLSIISFCTGAFMLAIFVLSNLQK